MKVNSETRSNFYTSPQHMKDEQMTNEQHQVKMEQLKDSHAQQQWDYQQQSQSQIEELKNNLNDKILEIQDEYKNQIVKLKDNFHQTKDFLDGEKKNFQVGHEENMQQLKKSYQNQTSNKIDKYNYAIDKMQNEIDQKTTKVNLKLDKKSTQAIENRKTHYKNENFANQRRLEQNAQSFEIERHNREKEFHQVLRDQKGKFFQEINRMNQDHQHRLQDHQDYQNGVLDAEKKRFNDKLLNLQNEYRKIFDEKFQDFHQSYLQLENTGKTSLQNLQNQLAQNEAQLLSKSHDPFYRPNMISPKLSEENDHFIIQVPLPEHEQNYVTMDARNRNIRLTYSRSHDGQFLGDDESQNNFHKTESYSKTLSLSAPIEHKKITQHYLNGILTFKLPKA